MENLQQITNQPGVWTEKIFVITNDFEIQGFVFLPKTGKRGRALSDILNSNKKFVAIKDCTVKYRQTGEVEKQDFIQLNLSSIILLRPDNKNADN